MIEKGVTLCDLFESNVFNYTFDFDSWPSTSKNTITMLRPYNGSFLKLRCQYHNIFKDLQQEDVHGKNPE